jgi:Ca-activated chloride channel family protein
MKQLIIFLFVILNVPVLFAQDAKSYIQQGNELYKQKKYKEAEAAYRKAAALKKGQTVESDFNLGDALYKEKKLDSAGKAFETTASKTTNPLLRAEAYHNLGNSLLTNKKYEQSIDAYKKALINNPQDDQTRYNLAYAQEMLKRPPPPPKNKNNSNSNSPNKNNNQNKNNQDKNKSDKDKSKQDKSKSDQNKGNPDKNNQGGKNQQGNAPPPDKVSKEDAQRMLDALNDQEKGTQEKLKNKKLKAVGVPVIKDW